MKTKTIISILALSSLCFSNLSALGDHHHGHKNGHSHQETIIGKTFLIHYTDQDYKLTFVTDSTIKWTDAKFKSTESPVYTLHKISRGIYLSSWEDKNGASLSQVIDMHGEKVYTAKLNAGKKLVNTEATITPEIVESTTPADPNKNSTDTATPDKK